jgi:Tfp pilus assembly protein PilO
MNKKKLTRLEQMGIIALVAVIACFFYVKKVYEPEREKFKEFRTKYIKLTSEVKTLRWERGDEKTVIASIQKQEENLQKAKVELKKTRSVLARKEGLPEILTEINRLAAQNNLKIREFSPAESMKKKSGKSTDPKDSERVSRNSYKMVMNGSFLDCKEFLRELGFLSKLVTIGNVIIERENESDLKIDLLLSI